MGCSLVGASQTPDSVTPGTTAHRLPRSHAPVHGVYLLMQVIEIFLPLRRKDGSPQPASLFAKVRSELLAKFAGLTAYTRAPAQGLWTSEEGDQEEDSIIVLEVMVDETERDWWTQFRETLECMFDQTSVLTRASDIQRL